jgi:hypothetical protein
VMSVTVTVELNGTPVPLLLDEAALAAGLASRAPDDRASKTSHAIVTGSGNRGEPAPSPHGYADQGGRSATWYPNLVPRGGETAP